MVSHGIRSIAAIAGVLVGLGAAAENLPACPSSLEPANWNGNPPIYIERDIETCRVFSLQVTYSPASGTYGLFWHEMTAAELATLLDLGFRIAFTPARMAGDKLGIQEFHNTSIDHYFLTSTLEAEAIDRGEAGPGWFRTGYAFSVRSPSFSPLTTAVYRFYGSLSPGPNSHFFTIGQDEYRVLRDLQESTPASQPRWNFEGVPFNAFPVAAGGACGASQRPVWRAYNGGFARGRESNHRFSTDKAALDAMAGNDWVVEGIAFCVDLPE